MRRVAAILIAAACWPAPAHAQDAYAAILLQYLTGDAGTALARLSQLAPSEISAGIDAFETTRARLVLTGAAAMHTELAFHRDGGGLNSNYHLALATAIVEFGEAAHARSNAIRPIHPRYAAPVSDEFRSLWYCTVINGLEGSALLERADKYLAHALELYPDNAEVQLLAGVAEEMRASPRVTGAGEGAQRKALQRAEQHYRAALAREPDRQEVRLRLGRVLQQREQLKEARALLTPLADSSDTRIAYLAALFLGGIEDEEAHAEQAAALYERAASRLPIAQTARLALSELRDRSGDRQAAADAIPLAAGSSNVFDPWWSYVFGEYWRIDLLEDAIRRKRRA